MAHVLDFNLAIAPGGNLGASTLSRGTVAELVLTENYIRFHGWFSC